MPRETKQSSTKPASTRGGKDGAIGPGKRHSSAPLGRQKEPMVTQEKGGARLRKSAGNDVPPDEDI